MIVKGLFFTYTLTLITYSQIYVIWKPVFLNVRCLFLTFTPSYTYVPCCQESFKRIEEEMKVLIEVSKAKLDKHTHVHTHPRIFDQTRCVQVDVHRLQTSTDLNILR